MKRIMQIRFTFLLYAVLSFAGWQANAQKHIEQTTRYPVLLNMVHHNPGEPLFTTNYTKPEYIKQLGYNGQVPKFEIQCALTYDRWNTTAVPENSEERLWIERHAAKIDLMVNAAGEAGVPMFPFMDVLVVPRSIMQKYGDKMQLDGMLSINKPRTQELLVAQIDEIFYRFPKLDGLTIRFGETYLHDTPFHEGTRPVYSAEDHVLILNLLREEVCVKRNKKLIYRTWDWGKMKKKLHLDPDMYLDVTNAVAPHPDLYFSIKHVHGDFLRGLPFNKTLGIGTHQQIVEVSINQAGMYGKNAHPYYIGKGIIEGWPEMIEKKGLRDLYNAPQVKGFWTWTWGDGWYGPYFGNEFWLKLNEYIIREFCRNPQKTEEELFHKYASSVLNMSPENIIKLRELCLLSVDAVFKGQTTSLQTMQPWWIRDHFFSAQDMSVYVKNGLAEQVLAEKAANLATWYKMEKIAQSISLLNKEDEEFLRVSTTYGRIKYELIELVFRTQILFAQMDDGKLFDSEEANHILETYATKWNEWHTLKKQHACCPTLYVDYAADHCQGNEPFTISLKRLELLLNN
ncbi:hypothetical protein [Mangrovibacterium sp.]|uniref:hypothetical protein n=1 Tax=Mangrovibacterium sp. TaxID=1961364 RepID=UPI0035673A62